MVVELELARMMLFIAAGGRTNVVSSWVAILLLFPLISVDAAGVGGILGRGMIARWWAAFPIMGPQLCEK